MTTLAERVEQWGEELNRHWLEKGIEKGIERGRAEGIERGRVEGIERGRVEGERELVCRLAARRFGPRTAKRLAPVLAAVSDPERIAAVADAVLECETAEEFIAKARTVART